MHYISKINLLLTIKKVTVRKLASEIGVSEVGLHNMLKSGSMKVETLTKIAECLDVPLSYFFEDSENNSNFVDVDNFLEVLKQMVIEKMNKKT
jgi:transcriptional regulator with XRE-family HTH domain